MAESRPVIVGTVPSEVWWWCYPRHFDESQCRKIKRICNRKESEKATTVGQEDPDDDSIRKNLISWHNDTEVAAMIAPLVSYANAQAGWNYEIHGMENMQYTIYHDGNDHYHWHTDTIAGEPNPRKLTCIVQLSDRASYDGGGLNLMVATELEGEGAVMPIDVDGFREQGSVLVFPSYLQHRVLPVTRGTRYSLVTWFRGPPWR